MVVVFDWCREKIYRIFIRRFLERDARMAYRSQTVEQRRYLETAGWYEELFIQCVLKPMDAPVSYHLMMAQGDESVVAFQLHPKSKTWLVYRHSIDQIRAIDRGAVDVFGISRDIVNMLRHPTGPCSGEFTAIIAQHSGSEERVDEEESHRGSYSG